MDKANAKRLSHRLGQRYDALDAIREATKIPRKDEMTSKNILRQRNEAIACLALPDLREARGWPDWPPSPSVPQINGHWQIYTRIQKGGAVSVRTVAGNVEITQLKGENKRPATILSECGRFVAVIDEDTRNFQLWDLSETRAKRVLWDRSGSVYSVAFRPDSQQVAVAIGHKVGHVYVHELPSGTLLKSLDVGPQPDGMAFHPSKPWLAVNHGTDTQVLDVEEKKVLKTLEHPDKASSVAWHPAGEKLATGCDDLKIYVWDMASPKPILELKGCKDRGIMVYFNRAGDLLASVEWGYTSRLWDWQAEHELLRVPFYMGSRFSPDDSELAPGIVDGTRLTVWELANRQFFRVLVRDPSRGQAQYFSCAISPDGRILAAGMEDGVALWDLRRGAFLELVPLVRKIARAIVFDDVGALLVNEPRGLMRWPVGLDPEAPTGLRWGPRERFAGPAWSLEGQVARNRDGGVIARAERRDAKVWHRDRPAQPVPLKGHKDVRWISVSPDGRWVATGSHFESKVMIWNARSGERETELPVEGHSMVAFSPDGRWLGTNGGGVRL
jgi:WD40 repeat protein